MTEPAVLDPVTSPALDEGWIRAVLFDHRIDDWVDLGPDPIRRRHVGQIYADHIGAAYGAWKWRCDRAGADVDTPPAEQPLPDALALEVGVTDWTGLMVALLTVGRAQSLLFADLASTGDDARRAFDRVGRDLAGHAALAYLELRRGTFVDRAALADSLPKMLDAARGLLDGPELAARLDGAIAPLLESLGFAG
jgi:hypothetical protein